MATEIREQIAGNLESVRQRMAEACARAKRDPGEVRLIAVVKYAPIPWVEELVQLGVVDLAESRPQQLEERVSLFSKSVQRHLKWHLIGHLQNNKVRKVLPLLRRIHSVDSEKLLRTIRKIGEETGAFPELLLEVNVSGEESKSGFAPEEVKNVWKTLDEGTRGQVRGLMTMAPNTGSLEDARRTFAGLRALRDELNVIQPGTPIRDLSMGMTGDFEVGIEEGATEVRIGSALFEGLKQG